MEPSEEGCLFAHPLQLMKIEIFEHPFFGPQVMNMKIFEHLIVRPQGNLHTQLLTGSDDPDGK